MMPTPSLKAVRRLHKLQPLFNRLAASSATATQQVRKVIASPTPQQKRPSGISLKNLLHTTQKDINQNLPNREQIITSEIQLPKIDTFELISAWKAFAHTISDESAGLADRFDLLEPKMSDDHTVNVVVNNPMLQTEINKLKNQIELFLRHHLSHPSLVINIILDDSHQVEKYHTRSELLTIMRKENPILEKLEQEFQLIQE